MKKVLHFASIALIAMVSNSVLAEGTSIDKSTVINATTNQLTNTQAVGNNATATTGSVTMKDSTVSKSTVINASTNQLTNTQAIGNGAAASTGSVELK